MVELTLWLAEKVSQVSREQRELEDGIFYVSVSRAVVCGNSARSV